jgi:hypothetical protein
MESEVESARCAFCEAICCKVLKVGREGREAKGREGPTTMDGRMDDNVGRDLWFWRTVTIFFDEY